MARFLIAAIAAVTAALGLVMNNVWLLGGGALFFLVALLILILLVSRRRLRRSGRQRVEPLSREEELRTLGISDVRPRTAAGEAPPPPEPDEVPAHLAPEASDDLDVEDEMHHEHEEDDLSDDQEEMAGGAAATPEAGPLPEREPASPRDDHHTMLQAGDDHRLWETHSPTAFTSFLRACWAAAEAQTALLAVEEHDHTYSLLAIRSHVSGHRTEGRFPADSFLHVASPERPLTVLEGNDPFVKDLPYYRGSVLSGGVAILPVGSADDAVYLVVDLPPDRSSFSDRQLTVLRGFAELLHTLLEYPPEDGPSRPEPTRRSIITEEMAQARSRDLPLSLALVYRTDAEDLGARGESAVAEAERDLRLLLEDLVQQGRVERFGEMMYGAFLHDDEAMLGSWAEHVRHGAEEGGFDVGIGIARMQGHADADALRADAANALAEALQSPERLAFAPASAE